MYRIATKIIGMFFFGVMLCVAMLTPTYPIGESRHYMLATIPIENRLNDGITESDVREAQKVFPEHKAIWNDLSQGFSDKIGDKYYNIYFPIYSAAVIPVNKVLSFLKLSQSYAYAITNVLVYMCAVVLLYSSLCGNAKKQFIAMLLMVSAPVYFYITWPSAEIFIFSFISMSITSSFMGRFYRSALLLSVAGMLNITVMPIALINVYLYVVDKYDFDLAIYNNFKKNSKSILLLFVSYLPSFVPLIINKIRFGRFVLMQDMSRFEGVHERFFAYFFDLNFGFIAYFPLLVIAYLVLLFNKDVKTKVLLAIIIFATCISAFGFSLILHINCGMFGIHRYNYWLSSVPLTCIIFLVPSIASIRTKIIFMLLVVSSVYTLFIVAYYKFVIPPEESSYVTILPLARVVLDFNPVLYTPLKSTFQSRIYQVDGGYQYTKPAFYYSYKGFIKKALMTKSDFIKYRPFINADSAFLDSVDAKFTNNNPTYIDFKSDTVSLKPAKDSRAF